jgi:hypothetical protein
LDRHLVSRDPPPVVNCKNDKNISMKPQLYDGVSPSGIASMKCSNERTLIRVE